MTRRPGERLPMPSMTALFAPLALIVPLAACMVGPDYQRPDAPMAAGFKEDHGGDGLWHAANPQDGSPRGDWWTVYGDALLDRLERQIDISNQNVKQYEAAYRQATAVADQARAGLFPTLSLNSAADRAQSSGASTGKARVANSFTGSVSASWEIDLWGRIRRQIEADEADIGASAADLGNARLSAQAALATDYFELRAADELGRILSATVDAYRRSLEITRNQYASGIAARSDVAQAESQLASTEASLAQVEDTRAALEHAISVLVGKPPADFSIAVVDGLPKLPDLPVGLASDLLERRPDVAAGERRVAAANADIGVAVAAYFPTLSLSGSEGFSASKLGDLFNASNNVWSVGPSAAMTLFNAGATSAQVESARAAYDQTVATYRQTVLTALQQVEDNLAALRVLKRRDEAESRAVASAAEAERLILNQYRAGTVAYTNVVTAQASTLSARQTALTISQDRLTATVALIQALGGGWQPPLPDTREKTSSP